MKTLKIAIVFILLVFNCKAGDSTGVKLIKNEFLFVELAGTDGETIYRNYKEDGYIDLIITKEEHVNAMVHFYEPHKIDDFKVAFVPGAGYPKDKDWLFNISDVRSFLHDKEIAFGVMEKEKFAILSQKFKDFSLIMVYKKQGVIGGNEIVVGR
jgi:hypothetical protein